MLNAFPPSLCRVFRMLFLPLSAESRMASPAADSKILIPLYMQSQEYLSFRNLQSLEMFIHPRVCGCGLAPACKSRGSERPSILFTSKDSNQLNSLSIIQGKHATTQAAPPSLPPGFPLTKKGAFLSRVAQIIREMIFRSIIHSVQYPIEISRCT
jgi:hypothetical protein